MRNGLIFLSFMVVIFSQLFSESSSASAESYFKKLFLENFGLETVSPPVGEEGTGYSLTLANYHPADYYLFFSSKINLLDRSLELVLKQRKGILICDNLEPISIGSDRCSFDGVNSTTVGFVIAKDGEDRSLAVLPDWNRGLLLLSPRLFSNQTALGNFTDFLSTWAAKEPPRSSLSPGNWARHGLDWYRGISQSSWFRSFAFVLLILILFRFYQSRYRGISGLTLVQNFWFRFHLFYTQKVTRWFFLMSGFSAIALLSILALNKYLSLPAATSSLGYLNTAWTGISGGRISLHDLRHLLELILLNLSLAFLVLAFWPRLLTILYKGLDRLISSRSGQSKIWSIVVLALLTVFILFRILGVDLWLSYCLGVTLMFFLWAGEIGFYRGRPHPNLPPSQSRIFLVSYLFLGAVFLAVNFWRSAVSPSPSPVFSENVLQEFAGQTGWRLVSLPQITNRLNKGQAFDDLVTRPSHPLWADDYLVFYPSAGKIIYSHSDGQIPDDLNGKKVAVYFKGNASSSLGGLEKSRLLADFLRPSFRSEAILRPTKIDLTTDSQSSGQPFFFYTDLFAGENSFFVTYRDLNKSLSPMPFFLNVYNVRGERAATAKEVNREYFRIETPQIKTLSLKVKLPKDDVYLLEFYFKDEPPFLVAENETFLNSLEFPSAPVFYLSPSLLSRVPASPLVLNRPAQPFVFEWVPFDGPAETILALGFGHDLKIISDGGQFDLGAVLSSLSLAMGIQEGYLIHYDPQIEYLMVKP